MRLFILFLICSMSFVHATDVFAQKVEISIDIHNQTVEKVLKEIEKQLINKGFKNETLQKMLNLKHELLKLEKAIQQQGKDTKRQSKSNDKNFNGSTTPLSKELKDYLNSVEILNRQSLPLQPNFNQKVQNYFKGND